MAVFNDLESFYAQLENDIINELREISIKIQEDMRLFWLQSVYANRSEKYKYTELLLNSARVSEPKKIGDEWIVEIYIDTANHKNPAWYNLQELGISVNDPVPLNVVAERMSIIGRSENIMDTMNEKWVDNSEALNYVLDKLRAKYDMIA
jgi:hypothetical protein